MPVALISATKQSIVSFGPNLLWMLVNPSMILNESDAGIHQSGKEIPVDNEAAHFAS
jgi:hypothetical protein